MPAYCSLCSALSIAIAVPACTPTEVTPLPNTEPQYALVGELLPADITAVDLLFVIDESGSMREEQESLAEWAQESLFDVLELDDGELPSMHIAVISTDLGGLTDLPGCEGEGDGGKFHAEPQIEGCQAPTDEFIKDIALEDGSRQRNFEGSLGDAFSCIAQLGNNGCGFEQPLEAMRLALDGSNPGNAGFLRDEALLAVIIVSDEDDCSVFDRQVFSIDPDFEDALGPLSSFRCFEWGTRCGGAADLRAPGVYDDCQAWDDSPYLTPMQGYVDFLKGLKNDPSMVVVAGITGDTDVPAVVTIEYGIPRLNPACTSENGSATPAYRLGNFFEGFPARYRESSICSGEMSGPLADTAKLILDTATRSPCLRGAIADISPEAGVQPDCRVYDTHTFGPLAGQRIPLANCDTASVTEDCFQILADADRCPGDDSGLRVALSRVVSQGPLESSHIQVECLTE